MEFILRNSGFLAIFFSWVFVILPSLLIKFDRKSNPISYTGTQNGIGRIFNIGLIVSASCEILFIYYLVIKLGLENLFGVIIFWIGSFSLILIGFITLSRSSRLHMIFAQVYFLFSSLGGLFIGLSLFNINLTLAYISSILAILTLLSMLLLHFKFKRKSLAEYLGIFFSTLWVLSFYILGGI